MEHLDKYSQLCCSIDHCNAVAWAIRYSACFIFIYLYIPESWPVFFFLLSHLAIKTALYVRSQTHHLRTCIILYTRGKRYKGKTGTTTPNCNTSCSLSSAITKYRRWNCEISQSLCPPQPVASLMCNSSSSFTQVCSSLWRQSLSRHTATYIYFLSSLTALIARKFSSPPWFLACISRDVLGQKTLWSVNYCCPVTSKHGGLIRIFKGEPWRNSFKRGQPCVGGDAGHRSLSATLEIREIILLTWHD